MADELKALLPCPFCGGQPHKMIGGDAVWCKTIGCAGNNTVQAEAWNRRATLPADRQEGETFEQWFDEMYPLGTDDLNLVRQLQAAWSAAIASRAKVA